MPRSQALAFAIRTRRSRATTNNIPFLQRWQQFASIHGQANHIKRTHQSCLNSSTYLLAARQLVSGHVFLSNILPRISKNALQRRNLASHVTRSRPQLPYLYNAFYRDKSFRSALIRHLTSQSRKGKWKEKLLWQLRFHAYAWPMVGLLFTMYIGYQQMEMEHNYPTPTEWSFWARWDARLAKTAGTRSGLVDWAFVGKFWLKLVKRLENLEGDGKGLREQKMDDAPIMIDGVGKVGFDISSKSEAWRQGYWECLMGLAKCAENLDGMCKRKGADLKNKLFRWENIYGPNNPRPKPVPFDKKGEHLRVPTFDEVEAAMDDPEVYYMKILTSKGFTNRQRLDTALAYADWCDFKGLKETSSYAYSWALDIAAGGLPQGADHVVDIQTGIINLDKDQYVTENLLKATTALGVWHARNGEVKEALPIFLSILRARRALPPAPVNAQSKTATSKVMTAETRQTQSQGDVLMKYIRTFVDFFRESDSLTIFSSGDERPYHSLQEACEEVGLMTYIGEILFATSEQEREKGLSWTRDSVEAAEAVLWFMDEQGTAADQSGRQKCRECLETGLANWQQMARQMTRLAKKKEEEADQSKGWLNLRIGQGSAKDKAATEIKRWEEEEAQIQLRRQKTASLIDTLTPKGNPFAMV